MHNSIIKTKMKRKLDKELLDAMWKNPENWVGPFYVNSEDPRIHVPKKIRMMGWTLNFGHKASYIGLSILIIIIVLFAYYL